MATDDWNYLVDVMTHTTHVVDISHQLSTHRYVTLWCHIIWEHLLMVRVDGVCHKVQQKAHQPAVPTGYENMQCFTWGHVLGCGC